MKRVKSIVSILLCLVLVFAYSTGAQASTVQQTMKLTEASGTVYVKDQNGASRKVKNGMTLKSGSCVKSRAASYASISLDKTKYIKTDALSKVIVRQASGNSDIRIDSGKVYFNISKKPSKQTVTFRTGIVKASVSSTKGTIGVISRESSKVTSIYILEGSVKIPVEDPITKEKYTLRIRAGEKAVAKKQRGGIEVLKDYMLESEVPVFACEEILKDEEAQERIQDATDRISVPSLISFSSELLDFEQAQQLGSQDLLDSLISGFKNPENAISKDVEEVEEVGVGGDTPTTGPVIEVTPGAPSGGGGASGGDSGDEPGDDTGGGTPPAVDPGTGGGSTGTEPEPEKPEEPQEYRDIYQTMYNGKYYECNVIPGTTDFYFYDSRNKEHLVLNVYADAEPIVDDVNRLNIHRVWGEIKDAPYVVYGSAIYGIDHRGMVELTDVDECSSYCSIHKRNETKECTLANYYDDNLYVITEPCSADSCIFVSESYTERADMDNGKLIYQHRGVRPKKISSNPDFWEYEGQYFSLIMAGTDGYERIDGYECVIDGKRTGYVAYYDGRDGWISNGVNLYTIAENKITEGPLEGYYISSFDSDYNLYILVDGDEHVEE